MAKKRVGAEEASAKKSSVKKTSRKTLPKKKVTAKGVAAAKKTASKKPTAPSTHTIQHFMWGYQRHFRIGQECVAERVFRALDNRFRPLVFLVGILIEIREDRYPSCVEPEDAFWLESAAFEQLTDRVHETCSRYPESRMFQSHPVAQQQQDDCLIKRAVGDLILQIINESPSRPDDITFFASNPIRVDDFLVATVLGLQTSIIASHYTLSKTTVPLHECRDIPVARSFIDAVIQQFLASSADELQRPNAGAGLSEIDTEETLRSAASQLITGIVWRIDKNRIEGMHTLFGSCNTIASLHYERNAGSGSSILARSDHRAVHRQLSFQSPTDMVQTRAARKLLELTSDELSLHSDSEQLYGLATIGAYDTADEDLFSVRILDHHHWELTHSGQPLMRVKYGQPYLPKPPFDSARLRSDLRRLFNGISDEHIGRISSLVQQAEQEQHGTILVISADAEPEAQRLRNQATPLVPCLMTPTLLKHLTPIDGAVLLSPDGICYAAGVILDGMATEGGDPGRGARFNSALRYVGSSKAACLAIVISEDRGIDFVPDLRPAIKRSMIDKTIKQLGALRDNERITRRIFVDLLNMLDEHRFYLLPADCQLLNGLIVELEGRLDAQESSNVKIIRAPFISEPTMDSNMYYETE